MAGGVGNLAAASAAIRASGVRFYVYVLHRPSGEPFYVGKGSLRRIEQHEQGARVGRKSHCARVIRSLNYEVGYAVAGTFADEAEAFALERSLIATIGRLDRKLGPLVNHTDGGEGSADPSQATIAKRVAKLRKLMADPVRRAKAVATLRSNEDVRRANAHAASTTAEFREKCAALSRARWADDAFRAKTVAAIHESRDLVWRANLGAALAVNRADPVKEAKRLSALRSDATRSKMSATRRAPAFAAVIREKAKRQRAEAEAVRQRVLALHASRSDDMRSLPDWRSGIAVWQRLEAEYLVEGGA